MPYASSIQIVNDANGAAHAFLADNGAILQGQWNAEAQRWDQGQLVPQAFGGEKLQALYLDNLWPTDIENESGFNPGIVLAYRVGSGNGAEIYASFGQWGGDGELSWSAPVQLTDDQVDDQAFSLVAAPSSSGGFSLVVQKKQAGTPVNALLDQLASASGDALESQLDAAVSGINPDSDLYVTQFNLKLSNPSSTGVVLTSNASTQTTTIVSAQAEPLPATTAAAFGGNTQLSREELQAGEMPVTAPAAASMRAMQAPVALGSSEPSAESSSPQTSSGQSSQGWKGGLSGQSSVGKGTLKYGPMPLQSIYRWELNIPANINQAPEVDTDLIDPEESSDVFSVENESSQILDPVDPDGRGRESFLDASSSSDMLANGLSLPSWQIIDRIGVIQNKGINLKWKGEFGIANYGTGGLASTSTAKIVLGYGDEDTQSILLKFITSPTSKAVWNVGVGGALQSLYQYSNGFIQSPTLTSLDARESVSLDASFKFLWASTAAQAVIRISGALSTGYEWIQNLSSEKLPEWLADVGYADGILGELARKSLTGNGMRYTYKSLNDPDPGKTGINRLAYSALDGFQGGEIIGKTSAIVGTVTAATGPVLAPVAAKQTGASWSKSSGWQFGERLTAAILFYGVTGIAVNLANRTTLYPYITGTGTNQGTWDDTFFFNAGVALPLGGMLPLVSYYHTWKGSLGKNNTASSAKTLGATEGDGNTSSELSSKGSYNSAGTGTDYPLTYAPAAGSNSYFSSANSGVALGAKASSLQQLTLGTTEIGDINPSATNSSKFALTLYNQGANLNDGSYTNVAILGATISGGLDTAALASFNVVGNSIDASSFKITQEGTYLALPQNTSNSGIYDLVLDVFSSGIANPLDQNNGSVGNPFQNLPLITLDSSNTSSPLTSQNIQVVDFIDVSQASTDSSQSTGTVYLPYNPSTGTTSQLPSNNNSSYIYSNVPVSLYSASNASQPIAVINDSINDSPTATGPTATVHLSNGVIVRADLNQPLFFVPSNVSALNKPVEYTIQLGLPQAVLGNNGSPTFSVTSQNLGFNNFVDEDQFAAQAGAAASGVYLAAGISDQLPLYASMGSHAVQNRVAYIMQEQSTENGELTTTNNIVYLNGIERYSLQDSPGQYSYESTPAVLPSDLSLQQYYINANNNTDYFFTAASTPTAVTIAGSTSGSSSSLVGDTFVAWVEASKPVIPLGTTEGGTANFQAYMEGLYGAQRINYRINKGGDTGWVAPSISDLYYPTDAIIRHLKAFNVPDPSRLGQERTLLVWTETAFAAIKGEQEALASGSFIPAVIKAGWINSNPKSTENGQLITTNNVEWNDLFSDDKGKSTIQQIPWDPTKDVGLAIEEITIASLPQLVNGIFTETPVVSWSQNVRTPYRQSVLESSPVIYLQFGELQSGLSDINIGSVDSTSTYTTASSTGLNFAVAGALPASQSTAVQNSDGTGVLSTGTGTSYSQILQFANNIPSSKLTSASANAIAAFTGSIADKILTVTSLASGSLDVGDMISGPEIIAGTTITALDSVDAATGLGTYHLNERQNVASTELEALPASSQLPIAIFTGSINGTNLSVSTVAQGSLNLGDVVSGQGIASGTTIVAGSFDANSGTGSFTVNNSQSVASSALVASPSTPTVPYTIEFWAQLPMDSNPNGAGLVAFGQPSTTAVGSSSLPTGWLLTSSFVVDEITYNEAAAKGLIESIPSSITSPSTTVYGWGWAMVADGANTTAMGGNGGNNLYSNALNINNLVNGSTIPGVTNFLNNYQITSSDLLGTDGVNTITSISQAPITDLQFSNEVDQTTGLANSTLNVIAIDTSSSVLNQGFVSANDAQSNLNLQAMFQDLWSFQQKTGEPKVNFSLAPDSKGTVGTPPNEFTSESYAGYELGFSLSRGTAVSVNDKGELVFDIGNGTSLVGVASDPSISSDLRDGQWHYIVASYLPNYESYTVAGSIVQLPTNVGTASIYVDNQLIAVQNNVIDAYAPVNLNDQALLLSNNVGGAIDQLAIYDKALSMVERPTRIATADFTGSIAGNTLTVTSITSGSLDVGDVVTGPGITAGTTISAVGQVDLTTGLGTYVLNTSQTVATPLQDLEALSVSPRLAMSSFAATISGTTLTVTQQGQGPLGIGYAITGQGITPGTTITGILPNAQSGSSCFTVNISQTVAISSSLVAIPSWPSPSAEDALAMLAALGYGIDTKTPDPGATPGAVTKHWESRNVNPNDALLGSYYSVFTPDATGTGGSWSNASNLNPATQLEATIPSASQPGSMQDDLVIAISPTDWSGANWTVNQTASQAFNPAHDKLIGITVSLTNFNDDATKTLQLTPEQVLLGSNTLQALQPLATAADFNYTVLTNAPAFNLVIPKNQLPSTGSNKLASEYKATYTFNFTTKSSSTEFVTSQVSNAQPVVVNQKGAAAISTITSSTGSANQLSNLQKRDSAIATAAVIEQAPIQLKYIDSGEVFKSASSTAAANTPAASSPANTFGASQVFGSYIPSGGNGNTYGWLAIAQPQSTNASSNPAGRIWIQYAGQSLNGIPTSDVANAPSTWLNALAQSNFSPDSPNLPLLGNAFNPSSTGGLLIEADPTVGWGDNFGQTMLVADVDNDGVLDLVIGAPQANGGGRVYIINGQWIENNLTTSDATTILSLANPNNLTDASGQGYVTVLTPSVAINNISTDDITVAGFGSALAFYNNTLWVGAPNYLRQLDPSITTPLVPIGAVYSYGASSGGWGTGEPTALPNPVLGSGGTAESLDPTGSPTTTYWGGQFGSSIAVNSTSGALAISAPGVYAGMLYSGTNQVQQQTVDGKKDPTSTYGDGALIKFQAPVTSAVNSLPSVSIIGGTSSTSTLVDIVDQSQNNGKNNGKEESAYMQSLKKQQADNIADATVYYNQALQVNAVGAVYLINDSADFANLSIISATAVEDQGGSTIYGPNAWNVLGRSGFGSSLAFSDLKNTNSNSILAIGANQTGGSGAVYIVDTTSDWPSSTLDSNQYLAHLVSGLTLYGAESQDNFGNGLVDLGDTNNDGYNDLLMQAYNASSGAGNGYVLFGSDKLIVTDQVNPGVGSVATGSIGEITRADNSTYKAAILSQLGYGLSTYTGQGTFGAGDVDGNGLNDVMLGSGPNGSAYLTWGQPYLESIGNLQLDKLTSNTGYMLDGLATTSQGSLRSLGDFNGDGYGDFISINSGNALTTVRIELGANTQEILADYPYNYYSFTVASGTEVLPGGDINGDGFDDIALFLDQNLSSAAQGNQGVGSTTGILYGRDSQNLPLGSGFGFLAPVDSDGQPAMALPGGDISGGLTGNAPAVINVGNTIYSVVTGINATSLWFNQSIDGGSTWSSWSNITNTYSDLASGISPSLAFFNNKLYLSFLNTDSTPALSISSWDPASNNPAAWSTPYQLSNAANPSASYSSSYSPQLINRGDALGVVWVDASTGTLSSSYSTTPDLSTTPGTWATPAQLLQRIESDSSVSFVPISATEAPSASWLGGVPVLALNNNGTINVYAGAQSGGSLELTSSFTATSSEPAISSAPVLTTTDTGLALTYTNSDGSITLQRLNFVSSSGAPLSGVQFNSDGSINTSNADLQWKSTTLTAANSGISTSLASTPVSVNGNLLLANVRNSASQSNQIWINAVPNASDPDSTTWLNSTIQLSDGQGGWSISQQTGTVNNITFTPQWTDDNNGLSPSAPAFAELGGVLYAAVVGDDTTTDSDNGLLYWNSSTDSGQTWSEWQLVPNYASNQAPSLAAFNGAIYMGYVGTNADIYIASLDASTNSWTQVQVANQSCQYIALTSENNELAAYYVGTNNDLYRTATMNPTSGSSWSNSMLIQYSGGNQTASGNLAVTTIPGSGSSSDTTYIAYQGGTPSSPSDTLYLTYSSNQSNGSSRSWNFSELTAQPTTANRGGVSLSNNSAGLLLGYPDKLNDELVYVVQQSANSGSTWSSFTTLEAPTGSSLPSSGTNTNNSFSLLASANSNAVLVGAINNGTGYNNAINTTIVWELPTSTSLSSSQTQSTLSAVGDLNGDGFADLLVAANNVVVNPSSSSPTLATGLRLISGAATSSQILNNNNPGTNTQSVQLAPWQGLSNSAPVALLSGNGQLTVTSTDSQSGISLNNSATLPTSTAAFTATAGDTATAQQLFQANAPFTIGQPTAGIPLGDLALISTAGFGDLNGDGYEDYLDPTSATVITGANSQSWTLWSIRAAGDVNGNGVDDVLLSLAPQGPAYVPTSTGSPTALQSVLLDGALFKVDTNKNTFSLANLKNPLNPFNSGEIYDVTSTSNNQYSPLLQNWFQPIDLFEPGNVTGVSEGTVLNITTAKSYTSPVGVVNNAGALTLVFPGQPSSSEKEGSGVWFAYQSSDGTLQQAQIPNTSSANWNQPASAAYFGGKLYVAWVDTSGNMHISYTSAYQDKVYPVDYAPVWTTYVVGSGQLTAYAPTLVAEEGRLALYFPADVNNNTAYVRYMYSSDPDYASNWGSVLDAGTSSYTNTQSAPLGSFEASSVISATTYQGRTVLAFYDGADYYDGSTAYLATAPSANPQPDDTWNSYSISSLNNLSGISLSTDQSLLYLTVSQTLQGTAATQDTTASSVYSLQPSTPGDYSTYSISSASSGPNSFKYLTSLNTVLLDGQMHATYVNSINQVELVPLGLTVSAPVQQSLSGYSIDGSIDTNGDGFTDILLSDPSDPNKGVNNQYVLFGGDYLDIASQVGTAGNDTLIGTPLADVIYTISGADEVISNGGADVIYTGSGDDQISITGNAFFRIDAGSGFDALQLEGLANQPYDFRLNVPSPKYFAGTKLRDIELISSQDYGANAISLDAAAVNAINPDRVLFLVPDSADSINLTSEFERSSAFDTSYAGGLWYAYVAGPNISTSSNPTLVYVRVPVGEFASDWLASKVTLGGQNVSARSSNVSLLSISDTSSSALPALGAAPTPSTVAGSSSFGDGLTVTAFKTNAQSAIASFQISRSDVSKSQLISYVSSSLNSSAEPGRHYTAVAGLLRLEAGQVSADVSVPIDAAAISALRNGTLSLQVQELADQGQKEFNLLLQPEVNTQEFRPVLSALELLSDPADATGNSISLGFRADINKQAQIAGLATTLKLKVVSRLNADDLLSAATTRAQTLSISDGVLSKFDLDGRSNMQVELELQVSGETGVIGLVAKSGKQPLVLSNLNSSPSTSVVVDIEYSSVDSVLAAPAPKSVILSDIAIDFSVSANGDGNASVYFELPKIAGDLALVDQNGKPIANQHVLLYVVDKIGSLVPFNYD
uniref:hypothetical protein n=1 Tax=Synechococcus sp. UW140 TaxID=368503 RepID=UPI003137E965